MGGNSIGLPWLPHEVAALGNPGKDLSDASKRATKASADLKEALEDMRDAMARLDKLIDQIKRVENDPIELGLPEVGYLGASIRPLLGD